MNLEHHTFVVWMAQLFVVFVFQLTVRPFLKKVKNQKPKGSVYLKVEHFYLYYFKYLFDLLNIINCFFNNIFFK